MRGWSIPLGRWFGVEMRIHAFYPLLALVCFGLAGNDGWARGLGLFFALTVAVFVRETARLLAAAWLGLRLRAVLVLPIGGLFAYANPESQEGANHGAGQFVLCFAGPIANLLTAGALALAFLGAGGDIQLFGQPLITSGYLLRSMVWMQAGLGVLHLLPAYPLDAGRLLRGNFARTHGFAPAGRAATGIGQLLALAVMLAGMLLHAPWLIIAGFFIMIAAQVEDQGVFFQSVVDTVHMREVMLTDFATLSPSATHSPTRSPAASTPCRKTSPSSAAPSWSASSAASASSTPCATTATATSSPSCPAPSRSPAPRTPSAQPSAASPPAAASPSSPSQIAAASSASSACKT